MLRGQLVLVLATLISGELEVMQAINKQQSILVQCNQPQKYRNTSKTREITSDKLV